MATHTRALAESIESGATLPGDWYRSDEIAQLEDERIWRRSWQYAGRADQVAKPGDFFTFRTGEVPIVVVRGTDGELRAFVNVCRHRGSEVVLEPCGNRKTLQCHYHAWTYGLDGCLRSAPRMEEQPGFDRDRFPLTSLQVEEWGPFVFVNPDPYAGPLSDVLGELPSLVEGVGLELSTLRFREERVYDIASNWKVVVENFLECYHCPVAHPAFTDLIDLDNYHLEEYDWFSTQGGPLKEGDQAYHAEGSVKEGLYNYVWPNFMLNVYPGPGNVSTNLIVPVGPNRTIATYQFFFADDVPDADAQEIVTFIDQVQQEDIGLCESVQRGLRSGFFDQGQLIVSRENGIRHFERMVARVLG